MKRDFILNRIIKVMLLVLSMTVGQNALAESTWEVTNENGSSNTFTIKRSEKGYTQTVHFRTISLSAYAGQHFTAVDMDYTFPADEDEKTVTVSELTPSGSYKYQDGTKNRKYRFEVTDRAGFRLDYADRTMTNGTSFSAAKVSQSITNLVYFNSNGNYTSDVNSSKYVDVSYTPPTNQVETSGTLNGYVLIDDSYDYAQKPATVSTSSLISTTNADATYLNDIGYKIYATVCFTEKEKDDGYQYIQIIAGNSSASYDTGYDPNGSVNDPVNSAYKTCFELADGSNAEGKQYFPHRYSYANKTAETNAGISITEFSQTNGKLWQQKFKSGYQATNSGSLIFNANTSYITTRFDSGGDNDDTWGYKDLFVRMALVDATAPTKLAASVNPGKHAKGNTVYVSVAFNEIVTVTGTPTLSTTDANNWGSLSYIAGSGTNVLTFSTTIPQDATGNLNITGLSGTVKDLAGNSLTGSGVTASNLCTLDPDFAYTINDFQQEGGNYLIKTHEDLIGLAGYVNGGGATKGKTFLQVADITFVHTTEWNNANSTENNYTAIGYYKTSDDQKNFEGTYDGGGYTISGIRIYRDGDIYVDNNQGLFGLVSGRGTVRNVNLANTRITAYSSTGGIVGYSYGIIEDCTVAADICIHAVNCSESHGGIVGSNQGKVKRCISRVHLTVKSGVTGCSQFGGIAGSCFGSGLAITDCIADGAVITDVRARGAILGLNQASTITLTRNYYHGCKVASNSVTPSGVGQGTSGSTTTRDVDGIQPLWAITLPTHASVVRTPATDPLPGTNNLIYDNGADINGVPYVKGLSVVNLSYDPATITDGYDVQLSVKQTSDNTAVAFADNGNHTYTIASMPAANITVTATEIPVIAYIDADGNPQSHACTPIVDGTFTQYLGAAGCTNWYVVSGEVSTKTLEFKDATTNIILCDGATLSVSVSQSLEALCNYNGSINIFAQSGGTGAINVTNACRNGIYANNSIDINGGVITVSNASSSGIWASNGDVTIRRGHINVLGSSHALGAKDNVNILGGIVNATGGSGKSGIIAANATLTLGCSSPTDRIYASSYYAKYNNVQVADGQILSDGTATYSGKLTSDEIAEIAGKTLSTAIPYIDADGTTKYKASHDLTFITTRTINYGNAANAEGWYCVNSNVTFDEKEINFKDQLVNIILCDGATMSAQKTTQCPFTVNNGSVAIYGQTLDTGTLTANSRDGSAIYAEGNIDFNGGTINASSLYYIGIYAYNNITIRRGNITAKGGIRTNSYGFKANGTITLGCATTADHIYATSYSGTVTIAKGQTLTDGISANIYTDTLTNDQMTTIKQKTMMKALGDISYIDENGQEQTCSNYNIISDGMIRNDAGSGVIGTNSMDTWYVASGNYILDKRLKTIGRVHLILCDGATFTVNSSDTEGINANENLCIYGQSQGTGTLTVNVASASGKALYVNYRNLVVNGGVINANGGAYGIYINNGSMTVNGGTINATGTTSGIHVGGNLTLGWRNPSDRITANSYSCTGTIRVKDGQQFQNGSSLLNGIITDMSKLNGKTLVPTVNAIYYIDADGSDKFCGEYTVVDSSYEFETSGSGSSSYARLGVDDDTERWYVVVGTINLNNCLKVQGNARLILCDGAALNINADDSSCAFFSGSYPLAIYGQAQGTGTLSVTNTGHAINVGRNCTIIVNGGKVIATTTSGIGMNGINCSFGSGTLIINRGTVIATATDSNGISIGSGTLTQNGGTLNATTGSGGSLHAGIYAYSGATVNILGGTLNVTGTSNAYGIRAYGIRAYGEGTTVILGDGIGSFTVTSINAGTIQFKRTFSAGKASTICLPFAMTSISGGKVYEFQDVTYDAQDGWVATMVDATPGPGNEVTSTVANTPYLFMPAATGEVTFSGTASASVTEGTTTSGDWTFHGTYSRVDYGTAPMTGHVYGFASKDKTVDGHDVVAGQFVKAKSGAYVPPFRAYLTYTGSDDTFRAPSRDGNSSRPDLPDRIKVRLISSGGTVTAVGTLDTVTGDVNIERWFDMNGRPVEGVPSEPGLYLNDSGKKIMIK